MSLLGAFDMFRNLLTQECGEDGSIEVYVSKPCYQKLNLELSGVQRLPIAGGFDMGIELFGRVKVKPLQEVESMREALQEMTDLKRENIRLRCALAGDGYNE